MPSIPATTVPPGAWVDVRRREAVTDVDVMARLARHDVVLLGEQHDRADHHRWQLDTITSLQQRRAGLVLGFEMFPRRVQPALERWSTGGLDEAEFLTASEWEQVWGFDAALYMPLFRFARVHRLKMVALNVDRATARQVAAQGFAAVPREARDGVGEPAPASDPYRARLAEVFRMHPHAGSPDAPARFERFVRGQLFWDRAMAEAIADARAAAPQAPVVAVLGRGHVEYGDGVPHQLAALGIAAVATALPWDADCDYPAGVADYLFGVAGAA